MMAGKGGHYPGKVEPYPEGDTLMRSAAKPRAQLLSLLDDAGWDVVRDRIIRGLCHDLNGRANAVSNIDFLMDGGATPWSDVRGIVEGELLRLEESVRLLRLLPDDRGEEGLLAPGELVGRLPALVRLQPGLEHVEVRIESSGELPAIRMDETLFTRCLLVLASRAAEDSLVLGNREIRLADRGPEPALILGPFLSESGVSEPEVFEELRTRTPSRAVQTLGRVVEGSGGRLSLVDRGGGPGFVEWIFPGNPG